MRIAFLSRKNPFDKRAWSGAFFSMHQELSKDHSIEWVKPQRRTVRERLILQALTLHANVNRKKLTIINKFYARSAAASVNKQLKEGFDVVYAAACPELLTYLNTSIPVVYFLDATFLQLTHGYPAYSSLTDWNYAHGMEVERIALAKASRIVVSSKWAMRSAVKDYGADPKKFVIVPFGANLQEQPKPAEIEQYIATRIKNLHAPQLLFIGKNWERKGGQLAMDAFKQIVSEGLDIHLTVVGSVPPAISSELKDRVTVIPNLNKNDENDFLRFKKIMSDHHVLILPTRADCTPIVFSEAAAFGMPVITTDVGGVAETVADKSSALVLHLNDDSSAYATAVKNIISEKNTYESFCISSRALYEQKLNWNHWREALLPLLAETKSKVIV